MQKSDDFEKLSNRISEVLKGKRGISSKNMFGGVCYLLNGNMLCGVDKKVNLMLRVGPEKYEDLLKLKYARKMDFTGRPMRGYLYIDSEGIKTKAALSKWIDHAIAFTKTLPKK